MGHSEIVYSLASRSALTPFLKQVTNEGATGDSAIYYVNLCRPLVPMQGKNCPPGSWACRIEGNRIQVSGLSRVAYFVR